MPLYASERSYVYSVYPRCSRNGLMSCKKGVTLLVGLLAAHADTPGWRG